VDYCRPIRANFDTAVIVLLVVNILLTATRHVGMSTEWKAMVDGQDFFFGILFLIETLIRMAAITPQVYLADSWNIFDTTIAWGAFIAVCFPEEEWAAYFRALRVLRVLKRVSALKRITDAFFLALRSIGDVFSALLLLLVSFSVLGIELFCRARLGIYINKYSNFRSFFPALYTLSRVALGGEWVYFTKDLQVYLKDAYIPYHLYLLNRIHDRNKLFHA